MLRVLWVRVWFDVRGVETRTRAWGRATGAYYREVALCKAAPLSPGRTVTRSHNLHELGAMCRSNVPLQPLFSSNSKEALFLPLCGREAGTQQSSRAETKVDTEYNTRDTTSGPRCVHQSRTNLGSTSADSCPSAGGALPLQPVAYYVLHQNRGFGVGGSRGRHFHNVFLPSGIADANASCGVPPPLLFDGHSLHSHHSI